MDTKTKQNNYIARKYFETLGFDMTKYVLHHKNVNLRHNNRKRYDEWRISDLVPMTIAEHTKLHMQLRQKDAKRTKLHNKHISNAMQTMEKYTLSESEVLMIKKNNKYKLFIAAIDIAKYLNCSKQLIYQVLNGHTTNKLAKGWSVEKVAIKTLSKNDLIEVIKLATKYLNNRKHYAAVLSKLNFAKQFI